MASVILKKSSVSGKVPLTGDLAYGEAALNYSDGRLWYKNNSNVIKSFRDSDGIVSLIGIHGGTGGGGSYSTINFDSDFASKTTSVLSEGSNLYYTNARARGSISVSGSLSYNSGTGVISFVEAVTSVAGKTGIVTLSISDISGFTDNSSNWNTAYGWGDHASGGYLPASSYTAVDVMTKVQTLDGAASGLDADLLDGQHGAYYAKTSYWPSIATGIGKTIQSITTMPTAASWSKASGYRSMIQASGSVGMPTTGTTTGYYGYNVLSKRDNGTGYNALLTSLVNNEMWFTYNLDNASPPVWRRLWNEANDGSGSGLDADLLDGQHASAFALSAHNHSGTYQPLAAVLTNTTASFLTAEKSKLTGIETGATADQTAGQILTAIKTVDGTTSGLDADLLDGSHASAFATAAQGIKADSAFGYGIFRTNSTGSAKLPFGTTLQRDASPTSGFIRFNTDNAVFEGYNGLAWGNIGGSSSTPIMENDDTISANYTISPNKRGLSLGPITINSSIKVEVSSGARWDIT